MNLTYDILNIYIVKGTECSVWWVVLPYTVQESWCLQKINPQLYGNGNANEVYEKQSNSFLVTQNSCIPFV